MDGRGDPEKQRRALIRVVGCFRTVLAEAIQVLAAIPPITELARERPAIRNKQVRKKDARKETLTRWKAEWEKTPKAKWTKELLTDFEAWVKTKHGNMNYYLYQAITNHGCFDE